MKSSRSRTIKVSFSTSALFKQKIHAKSSQIAVSLLSINALQKQKLNPVESFGKGWSSFSQSNTRNPLLNPEQSQSIRVTDTRIDGRGDAAAPPGGRLGMLLLPLRGSPSVEDERRAAAERRSSLRPADDRRRRQTDGGSGAFVVRSRGRAAAASTAAAASFGENSTALGPIAEPPLKQPNTLILTTTTETIDHFQERLVRRRGYVNAPICERALSSSSSLLFSR